MLLLLIYTLRCKCYGSQRGAAHAKKTGAWRALVFGTVTTLESGDWRQERPKTYSLIK